MASEEKQLIDTLDKEEEEDDEEEYVVEKIIRHKITKKNRVEFFLKWKGFNEEDNTWEPAENLNCPDLIDIYLKEVPEKERKRVRNTVGPIEDDTVPQENGSSTSEEKKKKRKLIDDGQPKKKKKNDKRATGFDKGLDAEEILGATETGGEVHFLIKWKNVNDAELVPSKIANIKIPQMVIAFYEARLTWSTVTGKSTDEGGEGEDKKEPSTLQKQEVTV